jgi:predicted nucleic acid-binding protein
MSRIYWDTMLSAYWLEDHVEQSPRVQEIFDRMQERGDVLCTSAFTVGELLTGPMKRRAYDVAENIRAFFQSSAVEVLSFTLDMAPLFAEIRTTQRVSPPDAIHLACAAQAGADLFLTNDHRPESRSPWNSLHRRNGFHASLNRMQTICHAHAADL